jgi:hypothetical protein
VEVFFRQSLRSVRRKLSVNHCANSRNITVVSSEGCSPPGGRRNSSSTCASLGSFRPGGAGGRCRPVNARSVRLIQLG